MKQKLLLTTIILLLFHFTNAQNWSFGTSSNLGFSRLVAVSSNSEFGYVKSGGLGVFAERKLNKSLVIGSELLWVQIEGKQSYTFDNISTQSRLHQSFSALPFYSGLITKKLRIKAAIQPMIFILGSSNTHHFRPEPRNAFLNDFIKKGLELERFSIGYKFGLDYPLSSHFKLRADFFYFSIDNYSFDNFYLQENIQATLGINYIFLKK